MQISTNGDLMVSINGKTKLLSKEEIVKMYNQGTILASESNSVTNTKPFIVKTHEDETTISYSMYVNSTPEEIEKLEAARKIAKNCIKDDYPYFVTHTAQEYPNSLQKEVKAIKNDSGKVQMELLSPKALEEIAEILTFGAKKYAPWNYLKGEGLSYSRVYGSLIRHMTSWYKGEELDEETQKSHLAHAGCCIMMLIDLKNKENSIDDRPK